MELESRMEEALGTRVNIQPERKGHHRNRYYSDDDLERLIEKIEETKGMFHVKHPFNTHQLFHVKQLV